MFYLPSHQPLTDRFNWYRWAAPVYESDEEIASAIKDLNVFRKTLKRVKVIGSTKPLLTNDRNGCTLIEGIQACEPIVFEFTDGSTVELLPQSLGFIRCGFNLIASDIKDGLNRANGLFDNFFAPYADLLSGKKLIRFEVEKESASSSKVISSLKVLNSYSTQNVQTNTYRMVFEGGFSLSLKKIDRYGYLIYIQILNLSNKDIDPSPERFFYDEQFNTGNLENIRYCWFYFGEGGYTDISPVFSDPKDVLQKFIHAEAKIFCDDDVPVEFLETFWEEYLDDEPFEHWGDNIYPYEHMRSMIEAIRGFVQRVDDNQMSAEDQERFRIAEVFGENGFSVYAKHREFMLQFCEYVECMMECAPDCNDIRISGP